MDELCTACLCSGRKLYNLCETGKISEWTDFFYIYTQILHESSVQNEIIETCADVLCETIIDEAKKQYTFQSWLTRQRILARQNNFQSAYVNQHFDLENFTIRVCFECLALLKKWRRFKQQVQESYIELLAYNHIEPGQSASLSKPPHLQIVHISNIDIGVVIKNEINESVLKCEDISFDSDGTRNGDDDVHHEQEMFVNDLFSSVKDVEEAPREETVKKNKDKKEVKKKKGRRKVKLKSKNSLEIFADLVTNDFCDIDDEPLLKNNIQNGLKTENYELPDVKEEKQKFICADCGLTFKFLKKLEYHVKKKHLKRSEMLNGEAEHVSIPVARKRKREKSPEELLDEKPTCKECGKNFSSKKTYRYHRNTLHRGNNRYPCPRCGKIYQWKSNLGRHLRSHKAVDNGELYCVLCDKRFASVATYRTHLKHSKSHVTESEFSFMCNECGKKFVTKTRLRDHIDWEHLKKIKFTCSLCSKPFKCHTSLYVHMQNVHTKNKKDNLCHVCGKSYQNAAKLKYHIVAMHTTETPYQCEQCNSAFGWYSSLYRHIREVHYKIKLQPKKTKKSKKLDLLPTLPLIQPQQPLVMLQPVHHGPP